MTDKSLPASKRKRTPNKVTPVLPATPPPIIDNSILINKSAASSEFYKSVDANLTARGASTTEFNIYVSLLSERYATYRQVQDAINATELTITQVGDKKQDRTIKNPLNEIRDRSLKDVMDGLKELGLTPKSKAALQLEDADAKLKREELMNRVLGNNNNKDTKDDDL
ncbi:P27 family phage terminase small subunit [Aeromonas salmonicida]|uniref:P27 family phage terminase small subunit n=1 Tax=Aeromonas salmonicida TaxID=645 RepID=UPI003D08DFFC